RPALTRPAGRRATHDEADISTKQPEAEADTRLSGPDAEQGGSSRPQAAPPEGTEADRSLGRPRPEHVSGPGSVFAPPPSSSGPSAAGTGSTVRYSSSSRRRPTGVKIAWGWPCAGGPGG